MSWNMRWRKGVMDHLLSGVEQMPTGRSVTSRTAPGVERRNVLVESEGVAGTPCAKRFVQGGALRRYVGMCEPHSRSVHR